MIKSQIVQKPKLLFISPDEPSATGKGYQVLLHHRILEMQNTFDCRVVIIPPLSTLFFYKTRLRTRYISNCSVLRPTVLDLLLGILRAICGVPLQVALHTRLKLFRRYNSVDYIYFVTSRCVQSYGNLHTDVICDFVDSMYVNFSRKAKSAKIPIKFIYSYEASRIKYHEETIGEKLNLTFCVSNLDAEFLGRNCCAIPLGVSPATVKKIKPVQIKHTKLVFSGSLNYDPNIKALRWFVSDIFPKLLQKHNDLTLSVIGRGASKRLIKSLNSATNVNYIGEVSDMYEALSHHDIAVAPMINGSGMQFKILEAMSVGLPVVTTTLGKGDIQAAADREILIGDSASQFATQVAHLLSDRDKYARVSESAKNFVVMEHSWSAVCQRVNKTVISKLAQNSRK